jgi:hypothetical protein
MILAFHFDYGSKGYESIVFVTCSSYFLGHLGLDKEFIWTIDWDFGCVGFTIDDAHWFMKYTIVKFVGFFPINTFEKVRCLFCV